MKVLSVIILVGLSVAQAEETSKKTGSLSLAQLDHRQRLSTSVKIPGFVALRMRPSLEVRYKPKKP